MSDRRVRFPLSMGRSVAIDIRDVLDGSCHRIEIAGSIRRGKPEVGDIELLCVPKYAPDLFGDAGESLLDSLITDEIAGGFLESRGAVGPKNKLLRHVRTGIPLDVFSTTEENWGMAMFVRTGPAEWNIRAMQRFRDLGMRGHAYGGVTLADGTEATCLTERVVFDLLKWPYELPGARA